MKLFDKLVNVIYPPKCIFCRQLLSYDTGLHICGSCYNRLPFAKEMFLSTAKPGGKGYCTGAISIFEYVGPVRESLIRFKYYNSPGYYRTYAQLMAERLERIRGTVHYDAVLCVPLHKQKEFNRGYNQAYLISRALAKQMKLPERSALLKRTRHTEAQSHLHKEDRNQNVKGAFTARSSDKIKGKSILLVDDILTTGSTVEECGRVLKEAGAANITAVVVATGRK